MWRIGASRSENAQESGFFDRNAFDSGRESDMWDFGGIRDSDWARAIPCKKTNILVLGSMGRRATERPVRRCQWEAPWPRKPIDFEKLRPAKPAGQRARARRACARHRIIDNSKILIDLSSANRARRASVCHLSSVICHRSESRGARP